MATAKLVIDWKPTALVLRQLAATLGDMPGEHLPKGAVVDALTRTADRLLAGEPGPQAPAEQCVCEHTRRPATT